MSALEKDAVLRTLCDSLRVSYDDYCARRIMHIIKEREIRNLLGTLVDIQLHTHRHRSPSERTELHAELYANQLAIEAISGDDRLRTHFGIEVCKGNGCTKLGLLRQASNRKLHSRAARPSMVGSDCIRLYRTGSVACRQQSGAISACVRADQIPLEFPCPLL